MTYNFECADGHDPITMTVDADDDDSAMSQMMAKAKDHLTSQHGGNPMTDEQMRDFITSNWKKS